MQDLFLHVWEHHHLACLGVSSFGMFGRLLPQCNKKKGSTLKGWWGVGCCVRNLSDNFFQRTFYPDCRKSNVACTCRIFPSLEPQALEKWVPCLPAGGTVLVFTISDTVTAAFTVSFAGAIVNSVNSKETPRGSLLGH